MLQINRMCRIFIFAAIMLCASALSAQGQAIKVNLIMDGGAIMVYSGSNAGLRVGDTFSVMRADREIGKVEITRVESTYSVAKVISQNEEIREMDLLIKPVAISGTPKADAKADSKKTDEGYKKKTDTKKDDKKADTKGAWFVFCVIFESNSEGSLRILFQMMCHNTSMVFPVSTQSRR